MKKNQTNSLKEKLNNQVSLNTKVISIHLNACRIDKLYHNLLHLITQFNLI